MLSIESILTDLINFIRRFAITFRDATFLPARFSTVLSYDAGKIYIQPVVYLLLSIFINSAFAYTSFKYYSLLFEPGEYSMSVIESLTSTSLFNKFLLAFPVVLVANIAIWIIMRLLRLPVEERELYRKLCLYWSASVVLFYNLFLITCAFLLFGLSKQMPQSSTALSSPLSDNIAKIIRIITKSIVVFSYIIPLYVFFRRYRISKKFFKFATMIIITGSAVYCTDLFAGIELKIINAYTSSDPIFIRNESFSEDGLGFSIIKAVEEKQEWGYMELGFYIENNTTDDVTILYNQYLLCNLAPLEGNPSDIAHCRNIPLHMSLINETPEPHITLRPHEFKYLKAQVTLRELPECLDVKGDSSIPLSISGEYFVKGKRRGWGRLASIVRRSRFSGSVEAITNSLKHNWIKYNSGSLQLFISDKVDSLNDAEGFLSNAEQKLTSLLPYFEACTFKNKISIFLLKDTADVRLLDSSYPRISHAMDSIVYLPYRDYQLYLKKELLQALSKQCWGPSVSSYLDEALFIYTDTGSFRKNIHRLSAEIIKSAPDSFVQKDCYFDGFSQKELITLLYSYCVYIIEIKGMSTFKAIWQQGRSKLYAKSPTGPTLCKQWQEFLKRQPALDSSSYKRLKDTPNPFGHNSSESADMELF